MNTLFIANLSEYTRSYQRYRSMKDIVERVIGLSFRPYGFFSGITKDAVGFEFDLVKRACDKLGYPFDSMRINQNTIDLMRHFNFDLIWVEKGLMLRPQTIRQCRAINPRLKVAFYSEDDMFAQHNQSRYFLQCLPLYDVVFTTKSYNCHSEELPSLGAKKLVFVDKAYDRNFHRPLQLTHGEEEQWGADAGFIGNFEQDRAGKMLFLANNGIPVRIWGNGWSSMMRKSPLLKIENKPIYGDDYIRALCATKVNLCFLRKMNRDLQTDRTMEIPACGAFMLAERTPEHRRLFDEDKEAAFFDADNADELLQKTRYYLSEETKRHSIAAAGRVRCVESLYSHHDRLSFMLKQL